MYRDKQPSRPLCSEHARYLSAKLNARMLHRCCCWDAVGPDRQCGYFTGLHCGLQQVPFVSERRHNDGRLQPAGRRRRGAAQFACGEREFEHTAALTADAFVEADAGPTLLNKETLEVGVVARVEPTAYHRGVCALLKPFSQ